MLVNLHTAVIGARQPVPIEVIRPMRDEHRPNRPEFRPVWFDGRWIETPIYRREHLFSGQEFGGPAIIEQLDATTVVEPQDRARVDSFGNLIIEMEKNG